MALIEKIFNPISSFHHKRISKYLSKLDIEKVVDIGAHKGEFLENMLRLKKVNSFYAFEPQRNIFNELYEKFSKNEKRITFCGRTGLFKYIDMIPAVTIHQKIAYQFLNKL